MKFGVDPNHGWTLLPLGDDGWDVSTVEGSTQPRFTVAYEASGLPIAVHF